MNDWKRFSLAQLSVLFVLVLWTEPSVAQPRRFNMVFAVSAEEGNGSMDAVVIVDGKQLRVPFTDEQKDRQKKIAEEFFASGRTYRLIFGGGEAGAVTVKKWSEGCNSVHADVGLSTSVRLGGPVRALA